MVSHTPYDKTRYRAIRQLQERMEADAGGKDRLPNAKLMVKGQVQRAPIYRFPLRELLFNKTNGRIRSEVLARESQLGRTLDMSTEEDQTEIKKLLLAIRPDENEKIKQDLRKNGQLQPGIVTCDGVVINGNRRKALLEELYNETHEEKYQYLEVHVLPSHITKAEIWLIEAGIQLSAPQQLDYSPINNLLKLCEGVNSGIDVADMATRIYGMKEEKLREDLARLDLMDEYLEDYLEKKGRYYLLEGRNEHFIDLQGILKWVERPRGAVPKDWDPDKSDVNELKLVAFQYIRAHFSHWRIRELRDLFSIKSSWEELKRSLDAQAETTLGGGESSSVDVVAEGEELEDEDGDVPAPAITTTLEETDFREERSWRARNTETLKEHFESAKEQQQIHKDSLAPLALARRALRNLFGIRTDSQGFDEPELDDVFRDIIQTVNDLRRYHKKGRVQTKKGKRINKKRQTSTSRRFGRSATKRKKKR